MNSPKKRRDTKTDNGTQNAGFVADDGIEIEEAAVMRNLGEIPESGNWTYIDTKTGRVLQAPGVQTEHHYQSIPVDCAEGEATRARAAYRAKGYERVRHGAVENLALPAAEIWRCSMERYEALMNLRRERIRRKHERRPNLIEQAANLRATEGSTAYDTINPRTFD